MYEPLRLKTENTIKTAPRLYHYTSRDIFYQIFNCSCIQMTNIRYQNDEKEFNYAIDLLSEVLKDYDDLKFPIKSELVEQIFTFSMSAKRDDPNQWDNYGQNDGHSFALTKEQIWYLQKINNFELYECIYDPEEQKKLIINLIGEHPSKYKQSKIYIQATSKFEDTTMGHKNRRWFARDFLHLACRLKDPKYHLEHEWRLVTAPTYDGFFMPPGPEIMKPINFISQINLQVKNDKSIPYIEANFDKDLPYFDEVNIGPVENRDELARKCDTALNAMGKGCKVSPSNQPLR